MGQAVPIKGSYWKPSSMTQTKHTQDTTAPAHPTTAPTTSQEVSMQLTAPQTHSATPASFVKPQHITINPHPTIAAHTKHSPFLPLYL